MRERLRVADLDADGARRARFKALYEENYHRILGYALRRTSRDEAADIVAETFLVAWRRLADVPEDRAGLLWLYGVARRVLANQERARRRRERLSERVRGEGTAVAPAGSGADVDVAAAFMALRADERELLALVAWEGLNAREIAQVYGCSRNAARIRVHRARSRFARELARFDLPLRRNPENASQAGRPSVGALVKTEDPL